MRIFRIIVIYLSIYRQVVRNNMAGVALLVGLWLGVNVDVHQVENRDRVIYAVRNSLVVNVRGPGRSQRADEKCRLWNNFLLEQREHVVFVLAKIVAIWRKNWLSPKCTTVPGYFSNTKRCRAPSMWTKTFSCASCSLMEFPRGISIGGSARKTWRKLCSAVNSRIFVVRGVKSETEKTKYTFKQEILKDTHEEGKILCKLGRNSASLASFFLILCTFCSDFCSENLFGHIFFGLLFDNFLKLTFFKKLAEPLRVKWPISCPL